MNINKYMLFWLFIVAMFGDVFAEKSCEDLFNQLAEIVDKENQLFDEYKNLMDRAQYLREASWFNIFVQMDILVNSSTMNKANESIIEKTKHYKAERNDVLQQLRKNGCLGAKEISPGEQKAIHILVKNKWN